MLRDALVGLYITPKSNPEVVVGIHTLMTFVSQEKEANLDIVLDRMRQDYSEDTLQENLKMALEMLEKIKEGFVGLISLP